MLDGYQGVLEILHRICQLHRLWGSVRELPSLLVCFLLLLQLGFRYVRCLFLPHFCQVVLHLLKLIDVVVFSLLDCIEELGYFVTLWHKLQSLKLLLVGIGRLQSVTKLLILRLICHLLLYQLVELNDGQSHIVPELRVSFQRITDLFEAPEGLIKLFNARTILIDRDAHIKQDFDRMLRSCVADMLVCRR